MYIYIYMYDVYIIIYIYMCEVYISYVSSYSNQAKYRPIHEVGFPTYRTTPPSASPESRRNKGRDMAMGQNPCTE